MLLALTAWGDRWATPDGGPPLLLRHAVCGARTTPTVCCSECGEPLAAADVAVSAGPGGRTAPGTALLEGVLGRDRAAGTMGA